MLVVGGFGGSRTSIFLPSTTSLPIFHALPRCILQGSPYRHTSPVERGNPLLRLVLCLSLTLHSFSLRPPVLFPPGFFLCPEWCAQDRFPSSSGLAKRMQRKERRARQEDGRGAEASRTAARQREGRATKRAEPKKTQT